MRDRIRALRKALNLNQTAFGARIGLSQGAITGYESGIREPSDAVIMAICRVYGVDEIWLRTGEGEMFPQRSQNEELALFLADIMADEEESIRKRFILALSHMGPAQWQAISDFCKSLMG